MGSPGIDKWIDEAPESWAKLAEKSDKKLSFSKWKTKFYNGAKAANKDYAEKNETFPFVLYGHTHSENQVPFNHDKGIDSFYINTGTWRSRIEPTLDQQEYVSLKTMTYTIFYAADERPSKCFDIWTGCQSNRRVQKSLQIKHPLRTDK